MNEVEKRWKEREETEKGREKEKKRQKEKKREGKKRRKREDSCIGSQGNRQR